MPLVEVTYSPDISAETCEQLRDGLPEIISKAVACRAEPYDGHLQPGDVLIRFREAERLDRFDVDLLIEVRSTRYADRAENRQARADEILNAVRETLERGVKVGVYLTLPIAAWSQTDMGG